MGKMIEMATWPRYQHYKAFMSMENPHLSVTFTVNVSHLVRKKEISLFSAILYLIHQTCNEIPEFHYRIKSDGSVTYFDELDLSFNILAEDGLFSNHRITPNQSFHAFSEDVKVAIAAKNKRGIIQINPAQDQNVIVTSYLPWFTYCSLSEPTFNRYDSIPRITWGKYSENGDIPITITAHHGLMDGVHIGKFYTDLCKRVNNSGLTHNQSHI